MQQLELLEYICHYLIALDAEDMEEIGNFLEIAQEETILATNIDIINRVAIENLHDSWNCSSD